MSEKTIALENINPVDILGVNDKNIELLKHFFSKVKIISRGEEIKIIGEQEEISIFEKKFQLIVTNF